MRATAFSVASSGGWQHADGFNMAETQSYFIPEGTRRERADKLLAAAFPEHSRSAWQRAFEAGRVTRAGVALLEGAGAGGALAAAGGAELWAPIRPGDSSWALDGDELTLQLVKADPAARWGALHK